MGFGIGGGNDIIGKKRLETLRWGVWGPRKSQLERLHQPCVGWTLPVLSPPPGGFCGPHSLSGV